MKRRSLLAIGTAALWPSLARAQPAKSPPKFPVVGLLYTSTPALGRGRVDAFRKRMGELGWVEGRTIAIDLRWGEGSPERVDDILSEYVRSGVAAIVINGDAQALAARRKTATIPIVVSSSGDPVGSGVVASLARPGGNVTGLSLSLPDTAAKRVELARELLPPLRRLAILGNIANPTVAREFEAAQAAARALGIEPVRVDVRNALDISSSIEPLKGRADALYVCVDPLVGTNGRRINELALAGRLPTVHSFRELVEDGGLICYGPDVADMFRRAADMTSRILKGAKPADLPVEQPTKFSLVVNLRTAKELGLAMPQALLLRTDETIE
jgi:putative ABC transport system substrate-binding protein